jgi:hypothetical protein
MSVVSDHGDVSVVLVEARAVGQRGESAHDRVELAGLRRWRRPCAGEGMEFVAEGVCRIERLPERVASHDDVAGAHANLPWPVLRSIEDRSREGLFSSI